MFSLLSVFAIIIISNMADLSNSDVLCNFGVKSRGSNSKSSLDLEIDLKVMSGPKSFRTFHIRDQKWGFPLKNPLGPQGKGESQATKILLSFHFRGEKYGFPFKKSRWPLKKPWRSKSRRYLNKRSLHFRGQKYGFLF